MSPVYAKWHCLSKCLKESTEKAMLMLTASKVWWHARSYNDLWLAFKTLLTGKWQYCGEYFTQGTTRYTLRCSKYPVLWEACFTCQFWWAHSLWNSGTFCALRLSHTLTGKITPQSSHHQLKKRQSVDVLLIFVYCDYMTLQFWILTFSSAVA